LTPDKTDEKDAVLIARLTAQLRCYEPEPVDETWARLRHLGVRREQLVTATSSQVQQMRDLLDCVWRAVLERARQPFRSETWIAALTLVVERDGGDLARTRRLGWTQFETAVRKHIIKQGGQKPFLRIARRIFAALADPASVHAHRTGAPATRRPAAAGLDHAHARLADTEVRMRTTRVSRRSVRILRPASASRSGWPWRDGRTLCGRRQGGSLACSTAAPMAA
jgi:transposase